MGMGMPINVLTTYLPLKYTIQFHNPQKQDCTKTHYPLYNFVVPNFDHCLNFQPDKPSPTHMHIIFADCI